MKKAILFLLIPLSFSVAYPQQAPVTPMVSVTGKGTVKVVPDEVLIRARIEHTGKSAAEVKAQNDQVVTRIIDYLQDQGVDRRNFQTEYLRLNKDYNYNTKETFYSANQALNIRLENLEKYENLMSGLLELGLNRIDGIQFQSSKQQDLEVQARELAVINAQEKAQDYAQALGQQVGKAIVITELEGGNVPPVYRVMEMKVSEASAEESIAPGELEISVRVNVSFLLL